jgi:hypothetical protein
LRAANQPESDDFSANVIRLRLLFENDLFGKPASTPDQVRAGFLRITLSLRSLSNTL